MSAISASGHLSTAEAAGGLSKVSLVRTISRGLIFHLYQCIYNAEYTYCQSDQSDIFHIYQCINAEDTYFQSDQSGNNTKTITDIVIQAIFNT
jgi:hypothetical protein